MKPIIIVKPGSLKSKGKAKLTREGNIVIEHEKAHEVIFRTVKECPEITYDLCMTCSERIYMTTEKLLHLKKTGNLFYCNYGHGQRFNK